MSPYRPRPSRRSLRGAHARGYTKAWQQLARQYYGLPCHYCGRPADTADHVIPKAEGGSDDPSNLVPACRSCNGRKQ